MDTLNFGDTIHGFLTLHHWMSWACMACSSSVLVSSAFFAFCPV